MTVLVTHPGRQHSHRAALALERAGRLAGYWSGVPSSAESFARAPAFLRSRLAGYSTVPLPDERVRSFLATPSLRRLGDSLLPGHWARWADFYACRRFDRQIRRRLSTVTCRVVLACEISARDTFRASRDKGLLRVLDAPSLHPAVQDRLHATADSPRLHAAVRRVKDEEIALADHVLTVSSMARDSYLEAGVAPAKVHAIPLGADLDLFSPPAEPRRLAPGRPLRLLFAGATIPRKGFDILMAALDRAAELLTAEGNAAAFELRLVGPSSDDAWRQRPWATSAGSVGQGALAEEMRRAHLLVLPSRNDSYGMVVAEAMATGLPVVVSDQVGAKDLVREGRNGWIVPAGDVGALALRIVACARTPAETLALAPAARAAAESATWSSYEERVATWFGELLAA
jgi:glycosyltransferase involved in cell wall biosynthesis